MVLVVLEGDGDIGAIALVLGPEPAARRQDDILGEGDVEPAVALDSNGPCEIGELDVHAIVAEAVAVGIGDQPACQQQTSDMSDSTLCNNKASQIVSARDGLRNLPLREVAYACHCNYIVQSTSLHNCSKGGNGRVRTSNKS